MSERLASVARHLIQALLAVCAVLAGFSVTSTTALATPTFTYDARTVARVDIHAVGAADASPAQLSVAREGSASVSSEAGGTSTTPHASVVATEAAPTLRGTNVAGEVTSRPGPFRQGTLQNAWDEAPVGANGGRVCTSCGAEMEVPPNSGIPRDWDASHNPSWSNREFPADVTRPQVLDNYNTGVGLECPGCNRSGGNRRW